MAKANMRLWRGSVKRRRRMMTKEVADQLLSLIHMSFIPAAELAGYYG